MSAPRLGSRVRALRRREGLTQAQMAARLDISPTYLNLIEHDRRPVTAPLLISLARAFSVDLASFAGDDESRLAADLAEVFGDALFEGQPMGMAEMRDMAGQSPDAARALIALYRAYRDCRERADALADQLYVKESRGGATREVGTDAANGGGEAGEGGGGGRMPADEVSDFIQRRLNHFPEVEQAAEDFAREARLDPDELAGGLRRWLEDRAGLRVERSRPGDTVLRRYDADRRVLTLGAALPPRTRTFQLAHQVGALLLGELLARLSADRVLTSDDSRALCRVALANYFAAATMMPYDAFLAAAEGERYDIELLGHRFRASFEQVCHRLTTLQRAGREGVPFHMIRVDIAGNISKRFSASGIRFARFAGACPRWNVHTAFLTPGMIRTQFSRMPDNAAYFCVARTVRDDAGGWNAQHAIHAIAMGCEVQHARRLVYADGIDVDNLDAAVRIGITCRLCERTDCASRAMPSIQHPMRVDESVRGVSFYAPVRG